MSSFGSGLSPLERGQPQDVLPASQYLQERLQERRARNTRPKRVRQSDFGPRRGRDDDIFTAEAEESRTARLFDSSPMAALSTRGGGSDAGHSSAGNRRRVLGVRDMDNEMDKLSKQNFALKTEIVHRRDQTEKLQEQLDAMREQVARAEKLEEEHAELWRINSELVEELEKREQAVFEALDIICDLEAQKEDLVERCKADTRPSTAQADSGYAGTDMLEHDSPSSRSGANAPPMSPTINVRQPSVPASVASQKLQGVMNGQTPARVRKEPNIFSEQKPSTQALRSVYMESTKKLRPVQSFQSMLSRQESKIEEDLDDVLNSPRLSVLSESSFPSIYSPKQHISPEHHGWENAIDDDGDDASSLRPRSHLRQDSIKRVSQWISERDAAESTPSKSNHISSPLQMEVAKHIPSPSLPRHGSSNHYHSLNDALSSAATKPKAPIQQHGTLAAQRRRPKPARPRPSSLIGTGPTGPLLPPTPDSVSTRMLRNSRSSIIDERSLLDITPAVVRGYDALEPGVRTAPRQMRSSVELSGAYASNLEHRYTDVDNLDIGESSEDEDFREADRHSKSTREFGLGLEYDGFPDGESIKMGIPSRFLKQPKIPAMFDLHEISPPEPGIAAPTPRRRRSSEQVTSSTSSLTKPRITRVETSPTFLGTIGRMVSGGAKTSAESVISPRSTHSGSSGTRTVVSNTGDQRFRSMSPEALRARQPLSPTVTSPTHSRTSPSPARIFGQKTQGFFRRMSINSQGGDRETREKSPLPTLTQAPASAYIEHMPIEVRRPMTSHADRRGPATAAIPIVPQRPSSREQSRPTLQTRTKTEPNNARPPSSSGPGAAEKEKRTLFSRSNSLKKPVTEPTAVPETRRRGSIRDAVSTARRPWR